EALQNDFRVAGGPELTTQVPVALPQLDVIINFAIKNDREPAADVCHRLIAVTQRYNRQPRVKEASICTIGPLALAVASAISDRSTHSELDAAPWRQFSSYITGNPAHERHAFFFSKRRSTQKRAAF